MDNDIYNSNKERYNFPGIFDFLKKYNCSNASKLHHDHHDHHHVRRHNHHKNSYKINPHSFHQQQNFKARQDKKQDATPLHDLKKVNQSGKSMEVSSKQIKHHHSNSGCFKGFILFSTHKKNKLLTQVSSFQPQTTQLDNGFEKNLNKAKSFDTFPSLGRSRSINEQGMNNSKTHNKFKTPSLKRTSSTGSRESSRNNKNGSLNRSTTSIDRKTAAAAARMSTNSVSKSGPIIMFSNSSGMLKPPPLEQLLECTLEELCHGCVKRIKVSRSVYTFTGHIMQEEEILTVNIKPGWRTGTKITFNGTTNDDRPNEIPGDIIFVINEKHHPLFRRIDDDLEIEIEIPLVDALTGCNINIPLLGKEDMSLEINEIIYPGHEKIIVGQGMPNQKNPNQMGDLRVKFLVGYPDNLTGEQRSEISRILSE